MIIESLGCLRLYGDSRVSQTQPRITDYEILLQHDWRLVFSRQNRFAETHSHLQLSYHITDRLLAAGNNISRLINNRFIFNSYAAFQATEFEESCISSLMIFNHKIHLLQVITTTYINIYYSNYAYCIPISYIMSTDIQDEKALLDISILMVIELM